MSASDHNDQLPQSLSVMTNVYGQPVFGWPVLLYCRFDTARTVPADWNAVNFAETSYEILPGAHLADEDPSAPFCRCKVHGFYAQADGQVVSRPSFDGIQRSTNHTTELNFTMFAGQTNVLEASTNLVHWTVLNAYSATMGSFSFSDTNAVSQRFYRIRTE